MSDLHKGGYPHQKVTKLLSVLLKYNRFKAAKVHLASITNSFHIFVVSKNDHVITILVYYVIDNPELKISEFQVPVAFDVLR